MTRSDLLAGAAVGALVGCLLGVSTQSEIGGAIAAVLTLATGLLGVARPAFLASASTDGDQNARMVAFGVTATILFLGTYILSVRHALDPSPKALVTSLMHAGYDVDVARALVASKNYSTPAEAWVKLKPLKP